MANYSDQEFIHQNYGAEAAVDLRIAVVTALWNSEITSRLKTAAINVLKAHGASEENLMIMDVPGSFELVYAANKMAYAGCDAIICLGCVIRGETPHFDFICNAVANGLTQVSIKHDKPVTFGVITADTKDQAIERAGGKHGNKGEEAALTALHLLVKH